MLATNEKTSKSSVAIPIPKHWEKAGGIYTEGDLAKAYLKGYETGRADQDNILKKAFENNLNKATSLAEGLFHDLLKKKFDLSEIHLKINGIGSFSILYVAKVDDFVSDKFLDAYREALSLKHKNIDDSFYITFSFMPSNEKLNINCLAADGFIMKYEKK